MKVELTGESLTSLPADALVVGAYREGRLSEPAAALDRSLDGLLNRLIERGEITGKPNSTTVLLAPAGVAADQVVVVGLGDPETLNESIVRRAFASVARSLASRQRERIVFVGDSAWSAGVGRAAITGSLTGCRGADLYRREKNRHPFQSVQWSHVDADDLRQGHTVADAINLTRRLVDEPPSHIYPETFADRAAEVAATHGLEIEIWDEDRLKSERCGALLAVAGGSQRPARLVMLKHQGADPESPTIGLVGKGVTFDSGGLSLKPSEGMKYMKADMAGAATVLGAMQAIAASKVTANVLGVMGLVENMPSQTAYKLGDVLTARNGTTIEVLNTDAEGRLVLADALDVAVERGADRLIDLATLTGACVVALGMDVVGAMTNDQEWCDCVMQAANQRGERIWQLPMFPEFGEQIKSEIADIKNVGAGRWGGAITAAKLLEEFVDGRPWVHLDIAGPAYLESSKSWQDAGGTGVMVSTLLTVVQSSVGE